MADTEAGMADRGSLAEREARMGDKAALVVAHKEHLAAMEEHMAHRKAAAGRPTKAEWEAATPAEIRAAIAAHRATLQARAAVADRRDRAARTAAIAVLAISAAVAAVAILAALGAL